MVYMYVCMHLGVYACLTALWLVIKMYANIHTYIRIHTHTNTDTYTYVYTYIHTHTHRHAYPSELKDERHKRVIHTYTYTYIHTDIHTYT